jgi:predicted dehydrogenase
MAHCCIESCIRNPVSPKFTKLLWRETCAATAERYSASGYAEYKQMLSSEQLDLVHICTPHHLHADMAITCLEQSINVLVEKPPATTIAAAQQMIDVAKRSQAQLGVCFQNRYNHTSQALHDTLQSHRLGDVRGAVAYVTWFRDSHYYRTKEWRGRWATAGGGVLINQAIHTLDLLLWFLGEVQDVRGSASTLLLNDVIEVEDSVSLVLTHAGGIRSVIFATNNYVYDAPITIEIQSSRNARRSRTGSISTSTPVAAAAFHSAAGGSLSTPRSGG